MAVALYLDTSAVLRATLETGTTPEVEGLMASSRILLTSRLSLVECARALIRARELHRVSERDLADVQSELDSLWSRCGIGEPTLHLATFLTARRRIACLELLTVDRYLKEAAGAV